MTNDQVEQPGASPTIGQRRRRVAEMTAAGYHQREIADALTAARYPNASKSTIGRDVVANEKTWRDATVADVQVLKDRHLQRLDADLEGRRRQMLLIKDLIEAAEFYTTHILVLMKERAKLLGLYAPTRLDVTAYIREWARRQGYDENRAVELAAEVVESQGF